MTYRTGILERGKHLWACLKRLIPALNIFHLHLTRPQSSLIACKRSRNGRGRPSTASAARASLDRVSLVCINRRLRDDWERVSICIQSNRWPAKTAVSPRSSLLAKEKRLFSQAMEPPCATTSCKQPSPRNDNLSKLKFSQWITTVATRKRLHIVGDRGYFFRMTALEFPLFLSSCGMVWCPCMLYVLHY